MVSNHLRQSFTDDGSSQFEYNHSSQVNCNSQPASFVETPPFQSILEKPQIGDEGVEIFSQSQVEDQSLGNSVTELSVTSEQDPGSRRSECHLENEHWSISNLVWVTSCSREDIVRCEHTKRPPIADELQQHAFKRVRQVDDRDQQVPFDLPYFHGAPNEPHESDAANKEFGNDRDALYVDLSEIACGSTTHLSWVTCSTSEEESQPELPIQESLSPSLLETNCHSSGFINSEETCLSILDYYARKHVVVGPDHQADIPAWNRHFLERLSKESDPSVYLHHVTDADANEKFMGTCIIPMPDLASVVLEEAEVTVRRSDDGSIRCVKQHVMEAREKLMEMLGQANFIELGFCDMGEYVAQKWTEDEQQIFHAVVSANPASLGKNFWDYLPHHLPSKSSKDLVSYYFNVFMLRKRYEQNRFDPLNIDSDNDEWQESGDGGFATEDSEGDSAVESPSVQDDFYGNHSHEEHDLHEEDDGGACNTSAVALEDHGHDQFHVLKGQIESKSSFAPRVQPAVANLQDVGDDEIQDESCTSYEGQHNGADTSVGPASGAFSRVGMGGGRSHDGYTRVRFGMPDPEYIHSP